MGLLDRLQLEPKSDPENESEPTLFEQDPEPGERPTKRRKATTKQPAPAARKPSASVARMAKEVGEDLASLIEMTAAVWGMSDQCCAPVLEQQAKPIATALTAILARNPRLLARFADTDVAAYAIQAGLLFRAVKPVAQAVYQNHVSKAHDGGEVNGDGVNLGIFPAYAGAGSR